MEKKKVHVRHFREMHIIQYDEKTKEIIYTSNIGGRKFKAKLKEMYGDILELEDIEPYG